MEGARWGKLFLAVFLGVLAGLAGWQLLLRIYPVLLIALGGFAVAYVFDPLLTALQRKGWPRGLSAVVVIVGLLAVLAVLGLIIVPVLIHQVGAVVSNWPQYNQQLQAIIETYQVRLELLLQERFPDLPASEYVEEQSRNLQDWLSGRLPVLLMWLSNALLSSAKTVGLVLLTLLIAGYFMVALQAFRQQVRLLLGPKAGAEWGLIDRQVSRMLGQYLRGLLLVCVLVGTTNALVLYILGQIFGTQYGLLLGAFSGVAYLVPYLGMAAALVAVAVLAYLTASQHVWLAVIISVVLVQVVNQTFDSFVMPRIVGRRVGLHPLVIILSYLAALSLVGIAGMILAAPTAAVIKIILAHWLPVVAPVPERPAYRQSLTFDVGAMFERGWRTLWPAARRESPRPASDPDSPEPEARDGSDDDADA